ncbi:MAG: hypothetical protein HRU12_07710 [Phaeodactylibacter sp.]|nr:hypothetical protein [Phaeodactylibacter sp.]
MRILFISFSLFALFACNTQKSASAPSQTKALDALQVAMTGSYSSAAQAAEDDAFFDITLHMYPIWKDRGHWLYVEQAVSAMPAKPYRQRVYKLEQIDRKTFKSIVYTIDNEDDVIGDWQVPASFDKYTTDNLRLREGCAVFLTLQSDGSYSGSTDGNSCKSTLRGAAYATSEVTVMPSEIVSWDRGFDDAGAQVWGAEKGGYIFKKL